jgi:hypothetical protein
MYKRTVYYKGQFPKEDKDYCFQKFIIDDTVCIKSNDTNNGKVGTIDDYRYIKDSTNSTIIEYRVKFRNKGVHTKCWYSPYYLRLLERKCEPIKNINKPQNNTTMKIQILKEDLFHNEDDIITIDDIRKDYYKYVKGCTNSEIISFIKNKNNKFAKWFKVIEEPELSFGGHPVIPMPTTSDPYLLFKTQGKVFDWREIRNLLQRMKNVNESISDLADEPFKVNVFHSEPCVRIACTIGKISEIQAIVDYANNYIDSKLK